MRYFLLPPALAPARAVVSFTLELPCTWPAPPETSPPAPSPLSACIPGCQYAPCWPACAGGPCPAAPPLPLMLRLCLEAVLHWLLSSCQPFLQAAFMPLCAMVWNFFSSLETADAPVRLVEKKSKISLSAKVKITYKEKT